MSTFSLGNFAKCVTFSQESNGFLVFINVITFVTIATKCRDVLISYVLTLTHHQATFIFKFRVIRINLSQGKLNEFQLTVS